MATFTNKATLSYNGKTTDSNIITGTINETLSINKTALDGTYADGSRITYIVSLVNSGNTSFTGLSLVDDLGGEALGAGTVYPLSYVDGTATYFANGVLQGAPTVSTTPTLEISGINVPSGGTAMVVYQADVTDFAPLDENGEVTNTVRVVGGGIVEEVRDSATITTRNEPNLSITKALSPLVVTEDGALTYTFNIQNTGNTEATTTDNVVVTDTFDPILTITSVTLNGTALTEGTDYTYNRTTGEFSTVPGVITVPAATYTREDDGTYVITPGAVTLAVNGNI